MNMKTDEEILEEIAKTRKYSKNTLQGYRTTVNSYTSFNNLSLYEMVDDVLNVEDVVIDSYLKEKLNMRNRNVYFDEGGFDDKE